MPPEALTVPALLAHNSDAFGPKPVIVTASGSIAHDGLDAASRDLASALVAAGMTRSSRVGVLMPNGIEWATTAAAVMRSGAVLVPLSTLLRPPELLAQLQVARVTELVVVPQFRERDYLHDLAQAAPGLIERVGAGGRHPVAPDLRRIWTSSELPGEPVEPAWLEALEDSVRPSDDLVILFTSGSRGAPKGVIHTHGGALRAVASSLAARCLGPDDRLYIPMPLFWTGGFASGLMSVLVAGATLVTEDVPDPETTIRLLLDERVTLFRGWPDQAARLAADPRFRDADMSHLGSGSLPAVLPPDRRPPDGARANLFGMTETFGPYCGDRLDIDLPPTKWGSCGRPFDGVEVRIFDPDSGRPCPPGADGEIGVRGPNVMRGICGRERHEVFDPDGFYRTGDLGVLDDDGYLWYRGRADDMFKVKGATVYPAEVEAALRSVEGVRQAFVADVADGASGRAVGAVVVSARPLERIEAEARQRLSSFKVPTRWYVTTDMDEVPRAATGKVDKLRLQEMLSAEPKQSTSKGPSK